MGMNTTIIFLSRSALVGEENLHPAEKALVEALGWGGGDGREARLTTLAAAAAMGSVQMVRILEPGELPGDVDMWLGNVDVGNSFNEFLTSIGGLAGRLIAVERHAAEQRATRLVLVDADLTREKARAFLYRRFRKLDSVTIIAPTRAAGMLEGDLVTLADAVGLRGYPQDFVERAVDERPF